MTWLNIRRERFLTGDNEMIRAIEIQRWLVRQRTIDTLIIAATNRPSDTWIGIYSPGAWLGHSYLRVILFTPLLEPSDFSLATVCDSHESSPVIGAVFNLILPVVSRTAFYDEKVAQGWGNVFQSFVMPCASTIAGVAKWQTQRT